MLRPRLRVCFKDSGTRVRVQSSRAERARAHVCDTTHAREQACVAALNPTSAKLKRHYLEEPGTLARFFGLACLSGMRFQLVLLHGSLHLAQHTSLQAAGGGLKAGSWF